MTAYIVLLLVVLSLFSTHSYSQSLRYVGQFDLASVAFLSLGRFNSTSSVSLLATSFGVLYGDALWYVPSPDLSNINSTTPTSLTTSITWPNEPDFVPSNTLSGYTSLVIVGGGFLVPTKSTGAVTIFDLTSNTPVVLSPTVSDYFYHRIRWLDIDGDGLKDIVTARATKPLIGSGSGELVWLKQPSSNPLTAVPWTETQIATGPDFLFELVDVDGDGSYEVAAAEYFGQKLSLTFSDTGNWNDPSSIQQIVIDANIGYGFDVHVLDVNGDGKEDIVATNHQGDGTGAIYAYEIPADGTWKAGNWTRHTLAEGFPVTQPGFNQASPGAPIPFYPRTSQSSGRMWIILAGDGSQCAYELRPVSTTGWDYTLTTIVNTGATVGQPAVGDVNGDGYVDVFIPAYDTSIVYAYTYAPSLN